MDLTKQNQSQQSHSFSVETVKTIELIPQASALVESMRNIGYTFETAVADLVDNSISAKSTYIHINIGWQDDNPYVCILDDGIGMDREKLIDAMRTGNRSPLDKRDDLDLGRFGLGLKTASFSQCRELTVATKQKGVATVAKWDLDYIAASNHWNLLLLEKIPKIGSLNIEGDNGTLVIWQKIDRLSPHDSPDASKNELNKIIQDLRDHLSLIFHRYLSSEMSAKKFVIKVNGLALCPFNPFNLMNPAGTIEPEEVIEYNDKLIYIQATTLPHHSKTTKDEWDQFSGKDGYFANQGFYIYRNKRLITHGTWFGIIGKTESTKLTRVRIDIDNTCDQDWNLDIKKSKCAPPAIVRRRLKAITERLITQGKRVFTRKGRRLLEDDPFPLWLRLKSEGMISYTLNLEHPSIIHLLSISSDTQQAILKSLLKMIPCSLPIDRIYSDYAQSPEEYSRPRTSENEMRHMVNAIATQLLSTGLLTKEQAIGVISKSELFKENEAMVHDVVINYGGNKS